MSLCLHFLKNASFTQDNQGGVKGSQERLREVKKSKQEPRGVQRSPEESAGVKRSKRKSRECVIRSKGE